MRVSSFVVNLATTACLALWIGAAQAATFTYNGAVTSSRGPAVIPTDPDFPAIGTAGTIDLMIDDGVPGLSIFDMGGLVPQVFTVSLTVPGSISGSMINNPEPIDFFYVDNEVLAFGAYGPTSIVDSGGQPYNAYGRHSFRVNFGTALVSTPTTIGELVSALNAPGAFGYFSHEIDFQSELGIEHTRVDFPAAVVPVPATGFLLLGGLMGLALLRRRRT